MKIEIWSVGNTEFTADPEFQEPVIREAIDQRGDVEDVIITHTDSERSNVSHDDYARVTGDLPGLVLFEGWLTGDRNAPPPAGAVAFLSAHFVGNGPHPLQLVCTDEDADGTECDETVAEIEPGTSRDELEVLIAAHAVERHAVSQAPAVPDSARVTATKLRPPDSCTPADVARTCGHEYELGDCTYTCERAPHPIGGHLPPYRHAAGIDAELAAGTDEGDGNGRADLVTWGEDSNGDGQDWEVAWGAVAEWKAGLTPATMSATARAAFLSCPGGNRLGNGEGWEAAAKAAVDTSARALAVAKAALGRLANCDYNPDNPGEQTFEIAGGALAQIAELDQ